MTNQVKTRIKNNIENLYKSLSIQFSLDGFSFSIKNTTTNSYEEFVEIPFDKKIANPEDLAKKITALFKENKLLQQDFLNVNAIHNNTLSTLVPNEYFSDKDLKSYLDFNIKTLQSDFITFDEIASIEAKNVYIPYVNLNNFLFQHFGSFEYKHHSTILIEKLISNSQKNNLEFYACVGKNYIDIIVINNNKLVFYNSFEFNTKEDFIYYILFTAEQLKLDPDNFKLTFIGDIEKESELYKITHQYIRNVEFSKIKNSNNNSHFILT